MNQVVDALNTLTHFSSYEVAVLNILKIEILFSALILILEKAYLFQRQIPSVDCFVLNTYAFRSFFFTITLLLLTCITLFTCYTNGVASK